MLAIEQVVRVAIPAEGLPIHPRQDIVPPERVCNIVTGDEDRNATFESEAMPHLGNLLGAAVRLTSDRAFAEDIVQETMIQAWKAFDQFQVGTNCKGWLFRIMFNLLSKHRRKTRLRPVTIPIDDVEATGGLTVPENTGTMSRQDILTAIDALPDDQRRVLVLAVIEGFKCREISEMLNLPIGTVMSRLARARAGLRQRLAPPPKVVSPLPPRSATDL